MSIPVKCVACGAAFKVLPEHAGRTLKCGKCGAAVIVPAQETAVAAGGSAKLPPMRAKPAAVEAKPVVETPAAAAKPAPAAAKKCPRCAAPLHSGDAACTKCGCDLALASLVVSGEPRSTASTATAPRKPRASKGMTPKQKALFLNSKGRSMEWVDVDRLVSPSVLMIIRNR